MTENPRTTSARDHDDHEIIDAAVEEGGAASQVGRAGGNLARDVGTQNELTQAVDDPDGLTRPTKEDDIANNVAYDNARRGDA